MRCLGSPVLAVLVLAGVAASATSAVAAETIHVAIEKLAFTPAQISAHVGDTIEWTNGDFVTHTATARNRPTDRSISFCEIRKTSPRAINAAKTEFWATLIN